MTTPRTLFVGLGSPHGDDRIGWIAAEELRKDPPKYTIVRRAESPADLLGWLELDESSVRRTDTDVRTTEPTETVAETDVRPLDSLNRLIVCDACRGSGPAGEARRWSWPPTGFEQMIGTGTHDLGLHQALRLAQQFAWLPPSVAIWTVEVRDCHPWAPLSPEVSAALPALLHALRRELACA